MTENPGYVMPLMADKKKHRIALIIITVCLVALGSLLCLALTGDHVLLAVFVVIYGVLTLCLWATYFVQIQFTREGALMTLWGIRLRRFPAERIRLITGAYAMYKGTKIREIALCDYTLEELTAYAISKKPKMFRNSRECRPGEWADEYLFRCLTVNPIPNRRILFVPWEPDRLRILQKLYPDAQWTDVTKDKIFDKQLQL